jgi:uncharacterized protein YyaL (SSP411 family)
MSLGDKFDLVNVDVNQRPDLNRYGTTVAHVFGQKFQVPFLILISPERRVIWATHVSTNGDFSTSLDALNLAWTNVDGRKKLLAAGQEAQKQLEKIHLPRPGRKGEVSVGLLKGFYLEMLSRFDQTHGGFGKDEKVFPAQHAMTLLRIYRRTQKQEALEMAAKSLQHIVNSKAYDSAKGGFYQGPYAVDWTPKNNEKSPSENALMLMALTEAWLVTNNKVFETAAKATANYLIGDSGHHRGLVAQALVQAGSTWDHSAWVQAGIQIGRSLFERQSSRHTNRKDLAVGTLEDYANTIAALILIFERTQDSLWITWALKLQAEQDQLFWSEEYSNYFDVEPSLSMFSFRTISQQDTSYPSGQSVAWCNLFRLAQLTAQEQYRNRLRTVLEQNAYRLSAHPIWYPFAFQAVDGWTDESKELVAVGQRSEWQSFFQQQRFLRFAPTLVVAGIEPASSRSTPWTQLFEGKTSFGGRTTYFVCENRTCKLPTSDVNKASELLSSRNVYKVGKD